MKSNALCVVRSVVLFFILISGAHPQAGVLMLPWWLRERILQFEASPLNSTPVAIWQIVHRGKPAYFFLSPCCDQFNPLFNDAGQQICSPSGGLAGGGDGRCPGPMDKGTQATFIWAHPAAPDRKYLARTQPPTG